MDRHARNFGCRLAVLLGIVAAGVSADNGNNLDSMYVTKDGTYKKNQPPNQNGKPLNLSIDIFIWSITDISAKDMEMSVDMFVEFSWVDFRLNGTDYALRHNITNRIPLNEMAPQLWKPLVHFRNCKGCEPLYFDPKKHILYFQPTTERLWTSTRTLTTFSCSINLRAYPMDKQMCKIQLESYFDELDAIRFLHGFDQRHKRIASNESLSEFEVAYIDQGDCIVPTYDGKLYACIEIRIYFVRHMGYYLITTYAPTILCVMLSWVSFWLPPDSAPARITLGVTSLLTLATRLDQTQKNLPAVSYVKAIDAWMFACIFLVFASLLEFSLSNYTWRLQEELRLSQLERRISLELSDTPRANNSPEDNEKQKKVKKCKMSRKEQKVTTVDVLSRYVFPCGFLIFNIAYWCTYL